MYRYAPNGTFICHLNIQPSSLHLSEFWSVCVDVGGHIIATDHDNGVYVFNPSGECVGHVSSDVIKTSAGVIVDEDGFVHMCSFYACNVVVFLS